MLVLIMAACARVEAEGVASQPPSPPPGEVLSDVPLSLAPDLDAIADGHLIRYTSTSGATGTPTEVTGVVFAPKGEPPQAGWPIVSVGHGTTGLDDECAVSRAPDLRGYIWLVRNLSKRGWVVAITDYEGLGVPGPHPYLEPRSEGFNVIDAARAAVSLIPGASTKWAAIGASQGGQATWAASELAGDYASELEFVGSANLSPAADLTDMARHVGDGRYHWSQLSMMPTLLTGLSVTVPELRPENFLHGSFQDIPRDKALLLGCHNGLDPARSAAISRLRAKDFHGTSPADPIVFAAALKRIALPLGPASGPMFVYAGGADRLIEAGWIHAAVRRACALGDTVQEVVSPGKGHVDPEGERLGVQWIADRFAGLPAPSNC
ncbi:lipase family protein [Mycobacteroides abscessus]|uniref:lipase family protein n=1 Tax=Mycobacteroides abscessus TaxID=36809 RepID=UPI001D14887A|nr:lipase family protein [Mycobacteroides abscessus]UEA50820.1 lipase family protein [Mycobacteroides abscessus subsp. abscessus]UEA55516.1 lipase family protein [Mycobacteroides abscessus]